MDRPPHQWENGWVCPHCYMTRTNEVDPCLGRLPGVLYACCGHGGKTSCWPSGYIYFENGMTLRFSMVAVDDLPITHAQVFGACNFRPSTAPRKWESHPPSSTPPTPKAT